MAGIKSERIGFLSLGYFPSRWGCIYMSMLTFMFFYRTLHEEYLPGNEFLPAALFAVFSYALIGQFAKELKTPHEHRSYYYLFLAVFFIFSGAIWYFISRSGLGIFLGLFFGFFSYHLLLAVFYRPLTILLNVQDRSASVFPLSSSQLFLILSTSFKIAINPVPRKKKKNKNLKISPAQSAPSSRRKKHAKS